MTRRYNTLVFDLDGTISNPRDGIVRSINYALEAGGFETRPEEDLAHYIGPPLDVTFRDITGSADTNLIEQLVASYRERYGDVGYAENVLYPDVRERLAELDAMSGVRLGVCSSKRVDFCERILTMFELRDCFAFVSGGEIGTPKTVQLEGLMETEQLDESALMIGDRKYDLVAGHTNGLDSAGVLWGFGSREELEHESPRYLFETWNEITSRLPLAD